MKDIDVSVIIPTYNVEEYVYDCLHSLINQTLDDFEIICVDDNSSDSTKDILYEFKNKDDRIKVFENKENHGQGYSRNVGLKNATGKYILFLDSDDWLDTDALEVLYNTAESKQTDILIYKLINYDTRFYKTNYYSVVELNNYIGKVFSYKDIPFFKISNSPCNKFFLNSFLKENNIYFPEGLIYEDNPFYFEVMTTAKRISIIDNHFYNRRRREGSTVTRDDIKLLDSVKIIEICLNYFLKKGIYTDYKSEVLNYIILTLKLNFNQINIRYKEEFFKKCKQMFNKFLVYYKLKDDLDVYLNQENLLFFNSILENEHYLPELFNYERCAISVILEIKDENNLYKCLNSLQNQSFKDFEIINVVSKENEEIFKMLDSFKNKFKKFKVLRKTKNRSAYSKLSLGRYLIYLNNRTYLEDYALEQMYVLSEKNKSDVLLFNSRLFDLNSHSFLQNDFSKDIMEFYDEKVINLSYINNENLLELPLRLNNQFFNREIIENYQERLNDEKQFEVTLINSAKRVTVSKMNLTVESYNSPNFQLNDYNLLFLYLNNDLSEKSKYYILNKTINDFKKILFNLTTENEFYFSKIRDFIIYWNEVLENNLYNLSDDNRKFIESITKSEDFKQLELLSLNEFYPYEISIIIPVYNAKTKYVRKCFNSILHQTFNYNKLEVIFIDDCSDYIEGREYIKTLIEKYPNVKGIFLDENKGSGNARNMGIKNALGKYIMFLDHDDYYMKNACQILYNTIQTNDVEMVSGNFIFRGGTTINWAEKNIYNYFNKVDNVTENLNFFYTPPAVYTKIFKKTFLRDKKIKFRNFKVGQDLVFMYETLFNADGIIFIDEPIMNYEIRNEKSANMSSISTNNSHKLLKTLLNVYKHMLKSFNEFAPEHTEIPLGNDLPYWTTKRLFKSNLSFSEFKDLMNHGKELYTYYLNNEKIVKNEICVTLFEDILKNNYIKAYENYKKWSGN